MLSKPELRPLELPVVVRTEVVLYHPAPDVPILCLLKIWDGAWLCHMDPSPGNMFLIIFLLAVLFVRTLSYLSVIVHMLGHPEKWLCISRVHEPPLISVIQMLRV
jgi:hypothetical protein